MDIMSVVTGALVSAFSRPEVSTVVIGFVTKYLTDFIKKFFQDVDENGVQQGYKVPLQVLITVCTAVATLGTLALKGQLSTFDLTGLMNFLTVAVPGYLAALGIHAVSKQALQHFLGRETFFPKKK